MRKHGRKGWWKGHQRLLRLARFPFRNASVDLAKRTLRKHGRQRTSMVRRARRRMWIQELRRL